MNPDDGSMDPWLEGQIRLADRQGLLQGRRLSQVQHLALQIILMLESIEKTEAKTDRMREALLGSRPELARALYPSYFAPEPEVVEESSDVISQDPDTAYDFRKVEWERPGELQDDDFAMLSKLLGNRDVTVSGRPGPQEEVEEEFNPNEIDDAEWT